MQPQRAPRANPYSHLPQETTREGTKRKGKKHHEFKSPPPSKPIPIPKFEIDGSIVSKLSQYVLQFDETRYSQGRCIELKAAQGNYPERLRVVSWNLLTKERDKRLNPNHKSYDADQLWNNRLPKIAAAINHISPDIFCAQELDENQTDKYCQETDLYNYIGISYAKYSEVHHDEGDKKVNLERNTIFLKREVFKIIHTHTYHCEGKTVGLVIAIYKDQRVAILNTHFSFEATPREAQARHVANLIKTLLKEKDYLIFFTDGNFMPNTPYNTSSKAGWDGDYIMELLTGSGDIRDAKEKSLFGHIGSPGSYTDDPNEYNCDPFKGTGKPGVRPDRIFVSKKIQVFIHAIDPIRLIELKTNEAPKNEWNRASDWIKTVEPKVTEAVKPIPKFGSDHQPVIAELYIPKPT